MGVAVPDDPDKKVLKFNFMNQDLWGISDLVAYGSQKSMTLYANTIKNLSQLYHNEGISMCAEMLLTANLVKQNVNIDFRPYTAAIIRR